MIEIRFSCFETNSSSVHVLVIPKDTKLYIPDHVHLHTGEYGWENDQEYDTLDYMYTACKERGQEEVDKFLNYLKSKGVEEIDCHDSDWYYVDHGNELPLDDLFANENLLDRFLFGEDSYVQTGNDNSDECPDEDNYDKEIYDIIVKSN